eukprot:scaffold60733_cov32-Tisochrysis_lutea.AAC.4
MDDGSATSRVSGVPFQPKMKRWEIRNTYYVLRIDRIWPEAKCRCVWCLWPYLKRVLGPG